MQNAKDTFYEVMRERLATVNAERTVVVRGTTRPAVLVEENELSKVAPPKNCFRLRWTQAAVGMSSALPTTFLRCEIVYTTAGSNEQSGMDRGRVLAAMDAELLAMVEQPVRNASKTNYAGVALGHNAAAMTTKVWWSSLAFGAVKATEDVLERMASVEVMALEEAGER
ncbi:MAG: hypothetical protein PW792_17530 [Acidobacteriaceae bacterium]|nr:hypothetical protein [Acidobacteriaceae bacterium]